jgi:hypothetical protein
MSIYATSPNTNFIYCDNCRLNNYLPFCSKIDDVPGIYCSLCFEEDDNCDVQIHTKMIQTVLQLTNQDILTDHFRFILVKEELLHWFSIINIQVDADEE